MRYGLKEETIASIRGVLARYPAVKKAMLYGSRAKGTFKPGSDIDLTLIGDGLTSQDLAAIDEELDDLLLPYQIDLSIFDQLDHVKLREHIERIGKVFYERPGARDGEKAGWQTKTLGEVCDIVGGGTPPKDNPAFYSGEIPWATVRDMQQDVITETEFRITKDAVKSSATNIIPSGNVVIATRVGLGKVCLLGQDTAINQDLRGIVPRNEKSLEVRYLFWWLKSVADVIIAEGTGATVQGVKLPFVKSLQIPVPPLAEQQRIVGLLDEAFEGLAVAIANAEKNLQNARTLFESHLQAVFTQRGPGWVEKAVKEIAAPAKGSIRTGPFGSQLLHSEFVTEGIAVLGIDNAVANEFRWGKSRFITPDKYRQLERYTVHPGDVLITIMGTCGRCAIVPDNIPTAINTKHICCITLDRRQCLPVYLHIYFLHAPQSKEFLAKHAKGAIMAGLNMGLIQVLPVMLPPVKVQAAIVEAADVLREQTQHLAAIYSRKLTLLAALKKSLLHQAFSGAL